MRLASGARAVVAAAAVGCGFASAEEAVGQVAVEVRDYARVPAKTLTAATNEAGRVLRKAGVEVRWLLPAAAAGATAAPEQAQAVSLRLRIFSARQATPVWSRSALGYAVLPANGTPGTSAGIRFGAVERQLRDTTAALPVVLGYVIAHELAHLLLESNAHAPWGVMSAQLSPAYFDRAAQGTLLFAADEAERLRAGVRSRRTAEPLVELDSSRSAGAR